MRKYLVTIRFTYNDAPKDEFLDMVPDKHIRKAIKEGLEALTGVFVTEQALPISKDTPSLHVQLNSQSRRRTAVSMQSISVRICPACNCSF